MKPYLKPLLILLLIPIIFLLLRPSRQPAKPVITTTPAPSAATTLTYNCQPGQTAFDLLQQNAQIEYETSSLGKLVTSINNNSQSDGKYWLYSIDDQEATVGADSYNCQSDEKITWDLK